MRCLRAYGERIAPRSRDRQTAEFHMRGVRVNASCAAEINRVA
jgi:hypothetical protein